jgi:hypothetical protein
MSLGDGFRDSKGSKPNPQDMACLNLMPHTTLP